jgi:putative N6-adenine-specific DNA methylase
VKQEIISLGCEVIGEGFTTVETLGTFDDTIRLNIQLRTANHVYFLVEKLMASSVDELYAGIKKIAWEEILFEDGYFSVNSVTDHPEIQNTMFLNLRVKDAVADRFQEMRNKRPDSGSEKNRAVIFVYWKSNEALVYIDTSGEPLTKHGYRKLSLRAPLQESLAAAMIMSTRWDKEGAFVNPMCGSGTLAIEAALMACNKAPGLIRDNFSFMHVKGYKDTMYKSIQKEAEEKVAPNIPCKIIAGDIDHEALRAARTNAEHAGVDHLIEFTKHDFQNTPIPEQAGVVMFNPPYGERLGATDQLEVTYAQIGDFLKKNCRGYWGYVFTANPMLAKKIGLKAKRKIDFYNGQLKCKLLEFELYEGSKKVYS